MKTLKFNTDSINITVMIMSPLELIFKGRRIDRDISSKTHIYSCYCGNDENAMIVLNKNYLNSCRERLKYTIGQLIYPGDYKLSAEESKEIITIFNKIMNYDE